MMPDVSGWETTPVWIVAIITGTAGLLLAKWMWWEFTHPAEECPDCEGVFLAEDFASHECGGGSPSGPSPVRDGRVSPDPTVAPSQAVADTRSPLPGVGEDGARTVPPTGR